MVFCQGEGAEDSSVALHDRLCCSSLTDLNVISVLLGVLNLRMG